MVGMAEDGRSGDSWGAGTVGMVTSEAMVSVGAARRFCHHCVHQDVLCRTWSKHAHSERREDTGAGRPGGKPVTRGVLNVGECVCPGGNDAAEPRCGIYTVFS